MRNSAVVDASVLAAIFLREQGWERLAERLRDLVRVCCPSFGRFEVANAVWKQRAISVDEARFVVDQVFKFPLEETFTAEDASDAVSAARRRRITFYDAAYLAMAASAGIPLWTLDRGQARAARDEGIEVWHN